MRGAVLLSLIAGCHLVSGYHELEGSRNECVLGSDCEGFDTPCSRRLCIDGACQTETEPVGTLCLGTSTCNSDGECNGWNGCGSHDDCTDDPRRPYCDPAYGLCVECTDLFECGPDPSGAAVCLAGLCSCSSTEYTHCRPSGCVNLRLDPFHCGGCNDACDEGMLCSGAECY